MTATGEQEGEEESAMVAIAMLAGRNLRFKGKRRVRIEVSFCSMPNKSEDKVNSHDDKVNTRLIRHNPSPLELAVNESWQCGFADRGVRLGYLE